ncbi:MAG: sensor histidine kinase [Spirochaetales bacterium]|nr:sensor histidine kinase [Spirochaetales bacterium]
MHFAVSDFILDMVQNSLEAGADSIELNLAERYNGLTLNLRDNGCGMTGEELERAKDPFYTDGVKHASRKVGLGIPFLIQMAETSDGRFDIKSTKGEGTEVTVFFNTSHIDTPPVGDLISLFFQAMTFDGSYELVVKRMFPSGGKEDYELVRSQLKEILGDLNRAENMGLLRDFITSQEEN